MDVTHVIRGDDHLTNAFRQLLLYDAMQWRPPVFAHVPLIHGTDGSKLSKRHGALGVEEYRKAGYLPAALRNYLLRLGWSHGDDEIISTEQAIAWFDLDGIGKSPARLDAKRLDSLNGHYIRATKDRELCELVLPRLAERLAGSLAEEASNRLQKGMPGLKERAKTIEELIEKARFYGERRPLKLNEAAARVLDSQGRRVLSRTRDYLTGVSDWNEAAVEAVVRDLVADDRLKLGVVAQPLRAALTGTTVSPGIFEVMDVLGREETLGRLDDILAREVSGDDAR
jgi:glutamyl-tRNA synthetase